jgi:hypothetical protein
MNKKSHQLVGNPKFGALHTYKDGSTEIVYYNLDKIKEMNNYGQRLAGSWKPNEVYTDLEEFRTWDKEEMVDLLIFLAHEFPNDQEFGEKVRQELIKFDRR